MSAEAFQDAAYVVHRSAGRARIRLARLPAEEHAHLEARLRREPGIRDARVNGLTGNLLVQFDPRLTSEARVLASVADIEVPTAYARPRAASVSAASVSAARPADPMQADRLVQSGTRIVGSALGLGLLAGRRLRGATGSPVSSAAPVVVAGVLGVIEGFPALREGARRHLGSDAADALFGVATIVSLTAAGGTLGLALSGLAATRVLAEVMSRRAACRRYEERVGGATALHAGTAVRLEAGERAPQSATVVDGSASWIGVDGLPLVSGVGDRVPAGTPLLSGPCTVLLDGETATSSAAPGAEVPKEPLTDGYVAAVAWVSLAYAALLGVVTRSPARAFGGLLLVSPRAAQLGADLADSGANARLVRAGVTVAGTRADRAVRMPRTLLVGEPRLLVDGFEVHRVAPGTGYETAEVLAIAGAVASATESPWISALPLRRGDGALVENARFEGQVATATRDGVRFELRAVRKSDRVAAAIRLECAGDLLLVLRSPGRRQPVGILALRPRVSPAAFSLVKACRAHGVTLTVLAGEGSVTARNVAERAGVALSPDVDPATAIRAHQRGGHRVAFLAGAPDAAAFGAADLAIALTNGRWRVTAHADLLVPDLAAVTSVLETAALRTVAARDAVILSAIASVIGAVWGLRGRPALAQAALPATAAALGALGAGWVRLRGGARTTSVAGAIADPRPERWGGKSVADVLRAFDSSDAGLSSASAAKRRVVTTVQRRPNPLRVALLDQIASPLTGILATGAALSLFLGSPADAVMIAAMLVANAAAGVWQELRTGQAAEALEHMNAPIARVLRDGRAVSLPAADVVPGDALLLARGDRVAADARLVMANRLEVDEASLTGESVPVAKVVSGGSDAAQVVLAGSDVTTGTGQAVVIAVGRDTRMGSVIAAMIAMDPLRQTPLTTRLHQMLRQVLPVAGAGGAIVALSGILRREPPAASIALGASVALAAVPEGLPLLASLGEAAVARRLAARNAIVRRPSAVEALGRVDTVCADKTGTMTEGRLALALVADIDIEHILPASLPTHLQQVLLTAGLAGPHPDAPDADVDPTDAVVATAVDAIGLGDALRARRDAEQPFESARLFHACVVQGRLCVEGAAEALAPRCDRVRRNNTDEILDDAGREALLERVGDLAARGLRVLMVAEGSPGVALDEPEGLVALGFLGLADPLRAGVRTAVQRCHAAGIRVIMITGDHPATAQAIGRQAGLVDDGAHVLTGADIVNLEEAKLDEMLELVTIIARATPVDKVRIVESLQRRGHTVAMTGDGVNDAPALRLADVGVAMGRGGTEVARQAADVVLADDDFATLVEAFVEGRAFWRNIRRALGLLLGGNLGELGLAAGAGLFGLASPLTSRQILTMNLMTDVLPALAVVLERPRNHDLAALRREGASALGKPLRDEVFVRGGATAVPSLAAYLVALRAGGIPLARTVAFASIVSTQLTQTLDAGTRGGDLDPSIRRVVVGTAGVLAAMLVLPPMRGFLGLVAPTPLGWLLIGGSSISSMLLARTLASGGVGAMRTAPDRETA
ncbi:MAG TPA: HAD-IC family P-type ATPase [Gemmatimonadaceae bacterium]|nr:HAD-IC family P-type ATPase [Gemmatimonadaceae bacterium]